LSVRDDHAFTEPLEYACSGPAVVVGAHSSTNFRWASRRRDELVGVASQPPRSDLLQRS
jgi:hypothetical protein